MCNRKHYLHALGFHVQILQVLELLASLNVTSYILHITKARFYSSTQFSLIFHLGYPIKSKTARTAISRLDPCMKSPMPVQVI